MPTAEEIVADIFAVLRDRLPAMELRSDTAGGCLRNAVRNRCLNHLRHRLCEMGYTESCIRGQPLYASAPDALYSPQELYELLRTTSSGCRKNTGPYW